MKLKLVCTLLCYVLVSAFHLPQHPLGDISGWSPFPFPGRKLLKETDLEKRNEVSIAQFSPSVLIISKKVMRKLLDLAQIMNGATETSNVRQASRDTKVLAPLPSPLPFLHLFARHCKPCESMFDIYMGPCLYCKFNLSCSCCKQAFIPKNTHQWHSGNDSYLFELLKRVASRKIL